MQNPNQNFMSTIKTLEAKNKAVFPWIVVCTVFAIVGISFGVFNLISTNNKSSEISELKTQIEAKDAEITALKSSATGPNIDTSSPTSDAMPSTQPYEIYANNLAENYNGSVFGYYYHYTGSENIKRTMSAEVNDGGHIKIIDLDNNMQLVAEADNIISVYFITIGNGSVPYFYLINKDGNVSRICIAENTSRTFESIEGYTNIVSIISGADLKAWLIDINGNLYKTY